MNLIRRTVLGLCIVTILTVGRATTALACSSCWTCGDPNLTIHQNAGSSPEGGGVGVYAGAHGCTPSFSLCPHQPCQIHALNSPVILEGLASYGFADVALLAADLPGLATVNRERAAVQVLTPCDARGVVAHLPIDPLLLDRLAELIAAAGNRDIFSQFRFAPAVGPTDDGPSLASPFLQIVMQISNGSATLNVGESPRRSTTLLAAM